MVNLFVIGNGFDMAHNLQTHYENFKEFLEAKYPNKSIDENEITSDISEDSETIFRLLIHAINECEDAFWSSLEKTLGEISYDAILIQNGFRNNDKLLENLETRADVFKDLFDTWVNEISLKEVEPLQKFKVLIQPGDLFLNFNYTRTLEEIYNVDKELVIHIHGEAGDQVEFGHGDNYRDNASEEEQKIHEIFRKNTGDIVEKYNDFFEDLTNHQIKKIYSFGFSYSEVDQIYIKKIIKNLGDTKDIIWLFNSYDEDKIEEYKTLLKLYGFKGTYDTFNTNNPDI